MENITHLASVVYQKTKDHNIYKLYKNRGASRGGYFTKTEVITDLNSEKKVCVVDYRYILLISNF